jgi:RNA polymerase sigma-70 factor (ECF subfamily)
VLVLRYTAVAHRAAYLLGAGDDAEDVVQEAFVKGFRGLGAFRQGAPFKPWLLRIVANETRNLHRATSRRRAAGSRFASVLSDTLELDGPETGVIAAEERSMVLEAVRRLPEQQRLAVVCRYFLDLSELETAQMLGWPRGTVKSRLSRALSRLRPLLATHPEVPVND